MLGTTRRGRESAKRYEKVAITLPTQLLRDARAETEAGHATSLSAYIAQAVAEKLKSDEMQKVLDEIFADRPMTDEERAWADQYLLAP